MSGELVKVAAEIVETTGKVLSEIPPVVAVTVGGFVLAGVAILAMHNVCCHAMAGKTPAEPR